MKTAQELIDGGLKLVKLKHLSKAPEGADWNNNFVTAIDDSATGYGFPLKANNRCSIDPDNWQDSKVALAELGFDLEALMSAGVRTVSTRPGSGGRSMFCSDRRLRWIRFASKDTGVVLELRANSPNLQDCVPGVQYTDKTGAMCTQQYYNGKTYLDDIPLPPEFFNWWLRMSEDAEYLREQQIAFFEALWVDTPLLSVSSGTSLAFTPPDGVRARFNLERDVEDILTNAGYSKDEKTGRLAPPTATGEAGVRPIPGKDGLWRSDHASDPLMGTFDAWTAFVVLEHGGSLDSAVRAVGAGNRAAVVDDFPVAVSSDGGELLPEYERVTGKGRWSGYKVSNTVQLKRLMSRDPEFPWKIAWDDFQMSRIISCGDGFELFQDHHYVDLQEWLDIHRWEPVKTNTLREVANNVAKHNRVNTAQAWINSLKWDGVDRYPGLVKAFGAGDNPYYLAVMRYMMTAGAQRILEPGCQADAIVVLISEAQGMRKSSAIQALAPKIGNIDTYQNISIETLLSDDRSARALKGCLIANLDEMRDFLKREQAEIKSAITKRKESYTPKYMEAREEYGRSCLFYATNNHLQFLNDETGSRRYHPIDIEGAIDDKWIAANRDQLWAQGAADYRANGQAWEEAEKLAPEAHKKHVVEDLWDSAIIDYLENPLDEYFTATDILTHSIGVPLERQNDSAKKRVGRILSRLGYKSKVCHVNGKTGRYYRIEQGRTGGSSRVGGQDC